MRSTIKDVSSLKELLEYVPIRLVSFGDNCHVCESLADFLYSLPRSFVCFVLF